MNLDLFNNLINKVKESDFIENFIAELSNYLEKANEKGGIQLNEEENGLDNTRKNNNLRKNNKNNNLVTERIENGLYQVVDFSSNGVYLQNTENNKVFEETNMPKELLDKIGNDYILRYNGGTYTIEQKLTDDFMNNMVGIQEYQKIKEEFEKESNILNIDSNTIYNIETREKDYTVLSYGKGNSNTIKVPNKLLPYFINEQSSLRYKNGNFEKVLI